MYLCLICNQYARLSLKEILRHVRDVHRSFSFPVTCGVNDCPSTASSYDTLRQHMYKKHKDELIPNTAETEDIIRGAETELLVDNQGDAGTDLCNESVANSPAITDDICLLSSTASSYSTSVFEAAKYILKVRDGKGLTQVVTNSILRDIQTLIHCTTESLEKKVMSGLMDTNKLSDSDLAEIQRLFSSNEDIFKGLNTEYKQETFFEENFPYVVCLYSCSCTCSYTI